MIRRCGYLVILALCTKLACADVPGLETLQTTFTGLSETTLRHQLGPVTRMNTFTLADPVPEERVEILNFVQPDWGNAAAETIREMIWETRQQRLVIWLRQQDAGWRAFHHNIILLESDGSGSVDCGNYH